MPKPKVDKGKKREECIANARKKLSLAAPGELEEYLGQIFSRAKEYDDLQGKSAIKQAMGEVKNELMESLVNRVAITARNVEKYERNLKYMKNGLDLYGFLERTNKSKDYNAKTAQFEGIQDLAKEVFKDLNTDEIAILETGKLDTQIAEAASGKYFKDPLIQKLGKLYARYAEDIRNPRMIASDALSIDEIRTDRFLRNFHDAQRMANAGESLMKRVLSRNKIDMDKSKAIWVKKAMAEADHEGTAKNINAFKADGTVDMEKLTEFFNKTFDKVINDTNDIHTRSVVANNREALEKRKRMSIVWKDYSAFQRYNKIYGKGTLHQALMADIHSSGRRIGLANIFGDSPVNMFKDLQTQQEKIRKTTKLQKHKTEGLFNEVTNKNKAPWDPKLANFGAALRSWSGISALGKLVFNSLNDITNVGAIAQRFGYGFWGNYADGLIHAFNLIPDPDRKLLARQLHANLKIDIGYRGSFAEASNMGEVMSKMSNKFYWMNLMESWTNGLKLSGMAGIGKGLGRDSEKAFKSLGSQTQYQLDKLGITPHEWDALRAKTKNKFFSLDNVDNLTNKELSTLWEKSDKTVTRPEYKSHLQRKVYGIFDVASENASLDPGAYEKMISTWGIRPGTVHGEAVRMFMQFKTYPISYFRKSWYGGWNDMQGGQAKLMYAMNMAAGNFILGYAGVLLTNIMAGKTTPSIFNMEKSDLAMLFAPGLGTFARVLSPHNQNPNIIANFFMTPSLHLLGDAPVAAIATATGNFKGAKRIMKDLEHYANPLHTVPIGEAYWNQLLGQPARLQPGQHQLFGR